MKTLAKKWIFGDKTSWFTRLMNIFGNNPETLAALSLFHSATLHNNHWSFQQFNYLGEKRVSKRLMKKSQPQRKSFSLKYYFEFDWNKKKGNLNNPLFNSYYIFLVPHHK